MPAAASRTPVQKQQLPKLIGERFRRFLAAAMLFVVAWVVWTALQINPPAMVLPAAYEAAAHARTVQNLSGVIAAPKA